MWTVAPISSPEIAASVTPNRPSEHEADGDILKHLCEERNDPERRVIQRMTSETVRVRTWNQVAVSSETKSSAGSACTASASSALAGTLDFVVSIAQMPDAASCGAR
jgi:diaminopimelate epimerase